MVDVSVLMEVTFRRRRIREQDGDDDFLMPMTLLPLVNDNGNDDESTTTPTAATNTERTTPLTAIAGGYLSLFFAYFSSLGMASQGDVYVVRTSDLDRWADCGERRDTGLG